MKDLPMAFLTHMPFPIKVNIMSCYKALIGVKTWWEVIGYFDNSYLSYLYMLLNIYVIKLVLYYRKGCSNAIDR